ncbi:hypothetical protein CsSME_00031076 [Camellia sinensis var. sinensis]
MHDKGHEATRYTHTRFRERDIDTHTQPIDGWSFSTDTDQTHTPNPALFSL